ncbi:MAG: hypothetical protein M3Q07_02115, partial [Pseudobdellovibrionaceae bacterium]|nr:hypothetical protein [Pseudobdellovibrionaceae bacterium]
MHKLLLKTLLNTSKCEIRFLHGVDLERFLDRGQIVDGVRYPTGYITEQGEAWGVYHQGALIGGYVVAVKGPFRTTTGLRAHGITHCYREEEMIELGGVWVEKEFRQKKYTTCLWLHMVSRIKDYNRPFLIYGYNLQRSGLQKLYAAGKPDVLFRGQSLGNSSVKTHSIA